MSKIIRIGVTLGVLSATALAQSPTFSLEAISVNGNSLPHPVHRIVVAPSDQLTLQVFIRDWSPQGERVRAYQAELDIQGFSSGENGTIQPVELAAFRLAGKDNTENAFIDEKHPMDIHSNLHCIRLTDTRNAPGYRWLSVVIDTTQAPESPQDGTKFYAGTVKMEVSEDASGVFTLGFMENQGSTGMMDDNNAPIQPVSYESLLIEVKKELLALRIVSCEPPTGSIDARLNESNHNHTTTITLQFQSDVENIQAGDFLLTDDSNHPPHVKRVSTNGKKVMLTLNRYLRQGVWTNIEFRKTSQRISIAALAGDINNDGQRNTRDQATLEAVLNGQQSLSLYRTDLDRNDRLTSQDMALLIHLLSPSQRTNLPAKISP